LGASIEWQDPIHRPQELSRDTIGRLIQRYRNSDGYQALAAGTVKYYKRYLRDIEALGSGLPFASFTRQAVVDFIETYPRVRQRRQAAAVLKNLFQLARYYGLVDTDVAAGLRLRTSKPRDRIWNDDEVARWLTAAISAPHMVTAFLLLQFTAQRPTDMLRMAWPHYSGGRSGCVSKRPVCFSTGRCTRCCAPISMRCPARERV
jgi:integrase